MIKTATSPIFDYANLLVDNLQQGEARNYSARGSYGSHCLGFTYAGLNEYTKDVLKLIAQTQRQICSQEVNQLLDEAELNTDILPDLDYLIDLLSGFAYDTMGRSRVVIYFPYKLECPSSLIEAAEDEDGEDDEDT